MWGWWRGVCQASARWRRQEGRRQEQTGESSRDDVGNTLLHDVDMMRDEEGFGCGMWEEGESDFHLLDSMRAFDFIARRQRRNLLVISRSIQSQMVRIVNGEVVDDRAPASQPSSASSGKPDLLRGNCLVASTLRFYDFFLAAYEVLLPWLTTVVVTKRPSGSLALASFYGVGSLILSPPSKMPQLPSMWGGMPGMGGGGGGGGGDGGGHAVGRRANIRGVGDLPARPRA
eukprot:759281-Hanusia_phi.AAC.2